MSTLLYALGALGLLLSLCGLGLLALGVLALIAQEEDQS